MKKQILLALLVAALSAPCALNLLADEPSNAAPNEQRAQGWDDYGRELRGWFSRWWDRLNTTSTRGERPLISLMLRNREKLGLSDDQVRRMEQLRTDFEKESIRKEADLRVAEMDLEALLDAPAVEMGKVEAKVKEIEKTRADLRIARIRAIEKAKELLTPDQRKKLQEILTEPGSSRVGPRPERKD
jgi:Spy/CpxP family protein refolding chaperone